MTSRERAGPVDTIVTRNVKLTAGAATHRAFLATPAKAPWKSAVVVVGDDVALDDDVQNAARRLAALGHGALAMGHGETVPSGTAAAKVTRWVDAGLARLRAESAVPAPRIGVVGYGRGGYVALVAAYASQVGVAVSLYGAGPMRLRAELRRIIDQPKRHAAPILCLIGGEDDTVRPEDLAVIHERLEGFGMRHTFIIYPRTKGHFGRAGGADYRAQEAADAWSRILHALETAPRLRNRSPPRPSRPG